MTDLLVALGLVFVIEGLLYAIAPDGMKSMMAQMQSVPVSTLRMTGLIAMVLGVGIVWLIRS